MGKYIIKRLLQLIPVLIGITFLSFAMMRLAGGDAVTYMYENTGSAVSQEVIDKAKAEYGLDKPLDRKSTRLNSSHSRASRMPSSA